MRRLVAFLLLVWPAAAQEQVSINAPYVTSTDAAVSAMLKMAAVTKNDVVYDLGCGDGRIIIAAAKQYGARGVGR